MPDSKNVGLHLACGALMVFILVLDLSIPLGVAMGVPYIAVVWISLWFPERKKVVLIAGLCSLLTVVAFLFKPDVSEMWKVILNRGIALFAIWVTASLGLKRISSENKRAKAESERDAAMSEIGILRGLLPICAWCKKVRDDKGYWTQIEVYISDHSQAVFSHGICPDCGQKLEMQFALSKPSST